MPPRTPSGRGGARPTRPVPRAPSGARAPAAQWKRSVGARARGHAQATRLPRRRRIHLRAARLPGRQQAHSRAEVENNLLPAHADRASARCSALAAVAASGLLRAVRTHAARRRAGVRARRMRQGARTRTRLWNLFGTSSASSSAVSASSRRPSIEAATNAGDSSGSSRLLSHSHTCVTFQPLTWRGGASTGPVP